MTQIIEARFKLRGALAADAASGNPVPLERELWFETDQGLSDGNYKMKIGDGSTHYNDLPYVALGGGAGGDDFAVASGTDTITATFGTAPTLTDGLQFKVRAAGANATTTPTFNPNSLGALTLYKLGGVALAAGDISGAGHELIIRYRASPARYELVNPAGIQEIVPGANVSVITTNPRRPVVVVTDVGGSPFSSDPYLTYVTCLANFDGSRPPIGSNLVGSVFAQATFANASQLCTINEDGLLIPTNGGLYSPSSYIYDMPMGVLGTVDVWVKPLANTQGNILTTRPASGSTGWLLRQESGGKIIISDVAVGGSSATSTSAVLSVGSFSFIRYIFKATTCELWVDGSMVASFTRTSYGLAAAPGNALTVGYSLSTGAPASFPGVIASLRITQGYARLGTEVPASHFF